MKKLKIIFFSVFFGLSVNAQMQTPPMYYADYSRIKDASGVAKPFAKDPSVIQFNNRFLMYYSICGASTNGNPGNTGWSMAIAESQDLVSWKRVGEIVSNPLHSWESKGICAPCAKVINGKVQLFYQTYGNGAGDAICHAYSTDGINFTRNATNPIFRPTGDWNCGRAIDAEIFHFGNKYFLYFATRDKPYVKQLTGVATAPDTTVTFNKSVWTQACTAPILAPEYPWEGNCTEGASIIERNGKLYMFYAGNYNNAPQQIGVAVSTDGLIWTKLSTTPLLSNGATGTWNKSESGHPRIFDFEGQLSFLFYQGNNDGGKTWWLSQIEIFWNENGPSKVPVTALPSNKVNDIFTVISKNGLLEINANITQAAKMDILNIDGTMIKEFDIKSNEKKIITVSYLKRGMYLCRLKVANLIYCQKVILK